MKKKSVFILTGVFVVAVLFGVSVLGANELRLFGGTRTQSESVANGANNLQATLFSAKVDGNVQEIVTQLEPDCYPAITVQKGVPVKWTMVADSKNLNSCNNEIIIPSLNITKPLVVGENVIEFTPVETGVIPYSCWMGMINSAIVVVDDINNYDKAEVEAQLAEIPQGSGSCGMSGGIMGGGGCCGGSR